MRAYLQSCCNLFSPYNVLRHFNDKLKDVMLQNEGIIYLFVEPLQSLIRACMILAWHQQDGSINHLDHFSM